MVSRKARAISNRIAVLLGSRSFYLFVLALFIFESVWIAFSALYPQAFDENFHFGLIQIYSHHWLPFLAHQPPNADMYGAVARDPSYLYHYLMSFPYRFFALFIHSQTGRIITMRLVDVVLFTVGLVLFRQMLRRVRVSDSLINVSLLLFILIPIVPQLAAQVNYDDLLFPLTAWVCLQTFNITDQLKQRKPSAKSLLILLITLLFTSLVKYAFLPVLFSVVLFLAVFTWRTYRHNYQAFLGSLKKDFSKLSRWIQAGLLVLLALGVGMLAQRDGVNLIKYHSVVPNCSRILSVKDCSAYSAWYVDYSRHQQVLSGATPPTENFLQYTGEWFYWMWYRLFFSVNGVASNFANTPPLPLPSIGAVLLGVVGAGAIIKWRHRLFNDNPYMLFLLTMCVVYSASLFFKGYATYKYTAVLENMNGRYLVPILLPIAAIAGLALSHALRHSVVKKVTAVVIVLALFLEGGGLVTFLVKSDDSWYWPNSTVVKINTTAHKIVNPVVVKHVKKQ